MKRPKSVSYPLFIFITIIIIIMFWRKEDIENVYYRFFFSSNVYHSYIHDQELNYRLYEPKNYRDKKLPLLLYLHPWGYGGSDNKKQINNLAYTWINKNNQKMHPSFVLVPQCPIDKEWVEKGKMRMPYNHYSQDSYPETIEMKMIIELINELTTNYLIDKNRIYVVGYSMGATGCWDILTRYPDIFGASVIASGVSDTTKAYRITEIPIWAFSGEDDHVAPAVLNFEMVNAVNNLGGNARLTIFPKEGHGIGYQAFNYKGVKQWLFLQSKE